MKITTTIAMKINLNDDESNAAGEGPKNDLKHLCFNPETNLYSYQEITDKNLHKLSTNEIIKISKKCLKFYDSKQLHKLEETIQTLEINLPYDDKECSSKISNLKYKITETHKTRAEESIISYLTSINYYDEENDLNGGLQLPEKKFKLIK